MSSSSASTARAVVPGTLTLGPVEFLQALFGDRATAFMVLWWLSSRRALWVPADQVAKAEVSWTSEDLYFTVALHDLQAALRASGQRDPALVRGSTESASAIPGLWVDVDVRGPAHTKTDLPPTFAAARDLLGRFPLSPTVLVNSGHGFHAWWLFRELWTFGGPDDRSQAQRLARRFQATLQELAVERGWSLDSTHDLARVLRLPGSFN